MLKSYHKKRAEQINANEIKIDMYEDKLNSFMIKLSGKELTEEDNARISQLMLVIGDFERMGDHATYILKIAETLKNTEKKLSSDAIEELKVIVHAVSEIFKRLKLTFLFRLDANFIIQEEIQYFPLLTVTLL